MALQSSAAVAFERPGGESCVPSKSRPIDLVHLARQTLGDRALEAEILNLFVQQLVTIRERIARVGADERRGLAHGLKGSARGVGAFGIADLAEGIEAGGDDRALLARLSVEIDQVREFIAAINR